MGFTLIKGKFRPWAGLPDGDSVRFEPNDPDILENLEGKTPVLGTGPETQGTVQLRLEGIDAIEKAATRPLSVDAKENLWKLINYDPESDADSKRNPKGYILARMTDDRSGRPICFIYAGTTPTRDGTDVFLDEALLRGSVNYQQALAGYAYPLYYNTLFASLRDEFTAAIDRAKAQGRGYWPFDKTQTGVRVRSKEELREIDPIWPKLWRRMEEWFRHHDSLAGFVDELERKNERIDLLDVMEERGLQDIVEVSGDRVKLTEPPGNIRVVGKAGRRNR